MEVWLRLATMVSLMSALSARYLAVTDRAFPQQLWYLGEQGMNVTGAWEQCVTGEGVYLAIVDDPICPSHPEITRAYHGSRQTDTCHDSNAANHGMMTAGIVVNSPDGQCGVGVAFDAKFQVHEIPFDDELNDVVEAAALTHNQHTTDIYSNSWGPSELSWEWGQIGPNVRQALHSGIYQGRNGKGIIYVWAAGNGGIMGNSCAYDGYINSPFTIAVAGAKRNGNQLNTGERCSAMFVTAYSQEMSEHADIVTSTGSSGCAYDFSDSSAAAPFVTGAVALMLQANPGLTWRDVQHIIVLSANTDKLNTEWKTNAAGHKVSSLFGFGLLNAGRMVEMARDWQPLPNKFLCTIRSTRRQVLNRQVSIVVPTRNNYCLWNMHSLEHVEVMINATYRGRGHLRLSLQHGGLEVVLLPGRYRDAYSSTINSTVMAVSFWGEEPNHGQWVLKLDKAFRSLSSSGMLNNWSVRFHGTRHGARNAQPRRRTSPQESCTLANGPRIPGLIGYVINRVTNLTFSNTFSN